MTVYLAWDEAYYTPREEDTMGETEDRKREARETDQSIEDRHQSELQAERDARDAHLGIGASTEDGPNREEFHPVGGNLPAELGDAPTKDDDQE